MFQGLEHIFSQASVITVQGRFEGKRLTSFYKPTKIEFPSQVMLFILLAGRISWQNICSQVISGQTLVSTASGCQE